LKQIGFISEKEMPCD